ncbi:MAG: 5-oxoprolinase subunit PxpA [Pseudomonadota bacterium]
MRAPGSIDLNADLGEGMPGETELMALVTSCNIACGGHAGDAQSMRAALKLAKQHGVSAGAHPSYPDLEGFGRRDLEISDTGLMDSLKRQVETLRDLAGESDVALTHLKPHGALYNRAAVDPKRADLIVRVARETLPGAALVGPPGSELQRAAERQGLNFFAEAFADRAYQPNGELVPRSVPGAVIEQDEARMAQALSIALQGQVATIEGGQLELPAETICLHGDSPGAVRSAGLIRQALVQAGIEIKAPQ